MPTPNTTKIPRCLLVGTTATIGQMARQIGLMTQETPILAGAVVFHDPVEAAAKALGSLDIPILGEAGDLDRIAQPDRFDLALVSLPAAMTEAISMLRTTLRRAGVPDRFMPTLEDQLAGVGPRSVFQVDVHDLLDRPAITIDEEEVARTITGKRVLITGAGGSIGSELARIAARYQPAELFLMDRSENALFEIDRQIARQHPQLIRGAWLHDVVQSEKTLAYCRAAKPQVIFHAAAHKHVPMMEDHPAQAIRNNFFGTKIMADIAAETGCERFVMISTDKAVNPSSVMGATKRLAELYIQYMNQTQTGTRFAMVRFGNVIGSNGSVLPIWSSQLAEGGPLTVTHPDMTRFFMTIPEAASLVIQAAAMDDEATGGGEVLVLDMGEPISILGLAKRFIEAHGLVPIVDQGGGAEKLATSDSSCLPIVITGTRPGEKLHEELSYTGEDLLPTPHPEIRVWKSTAPCPERVSDMVATLHDACERGDANTAVTAIHRLLPEMERPIIESRPTRTVTRVA